MHRRANRREERSGIAGPLHHEVQTVEGKLPEAEVDRRLGVANERCVPDVRDDADHLKRLLRHQRRAHRADHANRRQDRLADRMLARPLAASQRLIDDDDTGSRGGVAPIEEAAFDQRHSDRAEVLLVDGLVLCLRFVARPRPRPSGDEVRTAPCRLERQEVRRSRSRDGRLGAQRRQQPIVEVNDLRPVRVRIWQLDSRGHRARGFEAGILLHEPLKAAADERGADEQHHGQPDLGDDERAASAIARAAAIAASPRLLQWPLHVAARHQHRWDDAEGDRCDERHRRREEQQPCVDARVLEPRQRDRGRRDEPADRRDRDDDAERRADGGEQHAFGQELPYETRAARADGRADGDLALPDGGAREQQARHVRARDQEQKGRRAEEREERRAEEADDLRCERNRARAPVAVRRRIFCAEPPPERAQLAVCRGDGDVPLQAKDRLHEMRAAAVLRDVPGDPMPHAGLVRIGEPPRHHADNGEERAVQGDRLADDRRIASKPVAP